MKSVSIQSVFKVIIAISIGLLVGTAYRDLRHSTPPAATQGASAQGAQASASSVAVGATPSPTPTVAAPPGTTGVVMRSASAALPADQANSEAVAAAAAQLQTSVWVAGAEHDAAAGRIALPNGARFTLSVKSTQTGTLALHEQDPTQYAQSNAIWAGDIHANQSLQTPALRLEGKRGLETLYLVLRVPGRGIMAQSRLQIWHL